MVQLTRAAGSEVILAGMQIPPNYGAAYTESFAAVYRDLAEETEIELIPFFMEGVALNPEKLLPDMIHPNEDGQPILLENAWQALKPLLIKGAQSLEATSALP